MKKVRITKRALWVAKKPGQPNGYGATPASAFRDAERRKEITKAHRAKMDFMRAFATRSKDALRSSMNEKLAEAEGRLESAKAGLGRLAMLEKRQDDDTADGWVMMACAVVGTTNTSTALAEMRKRGATIGERERKAADRVDGFIARWTADMARGGPMIFGGV